MTLLCEPVYTLVSQKENYQHNEWTNFGDFGHSAVLSNLLLSVFFALCNTNFPKFEKAKSV